MVSKIIKGWPTMSMTLWTVYGHFVFLSVHSNYLTSNAKFAEVNCTFPNKKGIFRSSFFLSIDCMKAMIKFTVIIKHIFLFW